MNEDRLIAWLRRRTGSGGSLIGDDAAILPENERWAITMDTQIEGIHFAAGLDPADVARRLLAVNLSDLAAVGAAPAYALLALAAPREFDHRRFLTALVRYGERFRIELAGGDLARHSQTTAVLTLLGRKSSERRWLARNTARPGEALWLGGTVGEAAAGLRLIDRGARIDGRKIHLPTDLDNPPSMARAARRAVRRHLLPRPQLELGSWLGDCPAGAAIDVSDGLARDLHRLCTASAVGAEVEPDRLPLPRHFHRLARRLGCEGRELALTGGEDYVLLFTLPGDLEPPPRFACTRIGRILKENGVYLRQDGGRVPLPPRGWDHLDPGAP